MSKQKAKFNCLYCKKALKPFYYYKFSSNIMERPLKIGLGGFGYLGNNMFCSQQCGYKYALAIVRNLRSGIDRENEIIQEIKSFIPETEFKKRISRAKLF